MGFLRLETNVDPADSYYIDKQLILNTNKVGQVIINTSNELSVRYILPGSASLNINLTLSKSIFGLVPLTAAELAIERQRLDDALLLQSPGSVWRPSFDLNASTPYIYIIWDVTIV